MRFVIILLLLLSIPISAEKSTRLDLLEFDVSTLPTTCTNNQFRVDTSDNTFKQCSSNVWSGLGTAQSNSYQLDNLGLDGSVASSALTFDLKQLNGSDDPTSGGPVKIGFRKGAETSGGSNLQSVTSAVTIVIPSGATLGHTSGGSDEGEIIYIYAIDITSAVELAVSSVNTFLEDRVHTTTAIGTGSDLRDVLYSTTLRSNVPVRLIGKAVAQQTTAGTWDAVPTRITLTNGFLEKPIGLWIFESNAGQSFVSSADDIVDYEDQLYASHPSAVTVGSSWKFEPPIDGIYEFSYKNRFTGMTAGTTQLRMSFFKNAGIIRFTEVAIGTTAPTVSLYDRRFYITTDDINLSIQQINGSTRSLQATAFHNVVTIKLIEAR